MQMFTLSGNQFFDQVSYPVLLTREQIITYFNEPAQQLFRLLEAPLVEGGTLPGPLQAQKGMGVSAWKVMGEEWLVNSHEVEAGILYLIHPVNNDDALSRIRFNRLAERLRIPMTSMTAAIQILERNLVETERLRNEHYLAMIQKNYYRLMRLTGNLETFCHLEDGMVEKWYTPCVFDLAGLCRKIVRETDQMVEAAGATLSYQEEDSGVLVLGDDGLVAALIYHLLTNAVAGLEGEPGTVQLKLARQKKRVMLVVEDNGMGMNDRQLSAAFEPELDDTALKPMGFGLSICRRVATLHGGALMLTSGEHGTQVMLSLPIANERDMPELRSRAVDFSGGFPPALVAMSDVLPDSFFMPEPQEVE